MNCDSVRPHLGSLCDGELSPWRAWPVRRHVARCPACAAQVRSLRRLGILVAAADPAGVRTGDAPASFRQPSRRTRLGLALSGGLAACLLVAGLLVWLPGQPGQPTGAFADVERAVQNVRTAAWVETDTIYEDNPPDVIVTHVWARLAPPAYATRTELGRVLVAADQSLMDEHGRVTFSRRANRYTIERTNTPPGPEMRRQVAQLILGQITTPVGSARAAGPFAVISPWRADRVSVAGRSLLRFRRTIRPRPVISAVRPSLRLAPVDETVWADPGTHLVTRVESRTYDAWHPERLISVSVLDGYRYNVTPPPGIFDLTPPAGAKVVIQDWRGRDVTLSPAERAQIQGVIDRSEVGWRAGDFTAFAAVWDFDYARPLPNTPQTYRSGAWTRRNWRAVVEHQRGRWRDWHSRIRPQARTTRQLGYADAFPAGGFLPESEPDLLAVTAETHAAWARGDTRDKSWETTYTLRRVPGGWRIVHWSYRWPFTGQGGRAGKRVRPGEQGRRLTPPIPGRKDSP